MIVRAVNFTTEVCPLSKGCTIVAETVEPVSSASLLAVRAAFWNVELANETQTIQFGDPIPASTTSAASGSTKTKASTTSGFNSTKTCAPFSSFRLTSLADPQKQ